MTKKNKDTHFTMRLDFGPAYQRSASHSGTARSNGSGARFAATQPQPRTEVVAPTVQSLTQEEVVRRKRSEDREWNARTMLLEMVATEQRQLVDRELRGLACKVLRQPPPRVAPPRKSETRTRSHSPMIVEMLPSCPLPPNVLTVESLPTSSRHATVEQLEKQLAKKEAEEVRAMEREKAGQGTPVSVPLFGSGKFVLSNNSFSVGQRGGKAKGVGARGAGGAGVRTKSPQHMAIPVSSLRSMSQGQPPPPSYKASTSVTAFALKKFADDETPKRFAVSPPSPSVSEATVQ